MGLPSAASDEAAMPPSGHARKVNLTDSLSKNRVLATDRCIPRCGPCFLRSIYNSCYSAFLSTGTGRQRLRPDTGGRHAAAERLLAMGRDRVPVKPRLTERQTGCAITSAHFSETSACTAAPTRCGAPAPSGCLLLPTIEHCEYRTKPTTRPNALGLKMSACTSTRRTDTAPGRTGTSRRLSTAVAA